MKNTQIAWNCLTWSLVAALAIPALAKSQAPANETSTEKPRAKKTRRPATADEGLEAEALAGLKPSVQAALKSTLDAYRASDAGKSDHEVRKAEREADQAETARINANPDPAERQRQLEAFESNKLAMHEGDEAARDAARENIATFKSWSVAKQLAYLHASSATSPHHIWDGVSSFAYRAVASDSQSTH